MNTEQILKHKYAPKDAESAPQVDPATISATELLIREKFAKDTIAVSPSEPSVGAVTKQAHPVDEEASPEAVEAFKAALELLEKKASAKRARELVETIKRAKEGK